MTRRDRQRDARAAMLPWEVGKAFDHCAPCGALHRASECGSQSKGAITLQVNGSEKQRGDLEQMIWNNSEILVQLSRQVTLMPGDLIMTGTPAGVAAVHPGDVIVAVVEGLTPLTIHIGPKGSPLVQEA
jgi:fumarylpyruvate hydrolase